MNHDEPWFCHKYHANSKRKSQSWSWLACHGCRHLDHDLLCKRLCHRPNSGSSVGVFTYLVAGPNKNWWNHWWIMEVSRIVHYWLPKLIDKQADVPWNWVFPHVWHAWHVGLEGQRRVYVQRWVVLRRYWKSVALGFNVSFLIQDGASNFKKCTFLDLINSIESTSCNSKFDCVWQSGFI